MFGFIDYLYDFIVKYSNYHISVCFYIHMSLYINNKITDLSCLK